MGKTRILVEGALFLAIAAIFQLIPVFFSELFFFLTLISTLPIYLITRKNYKVGIASYITTSFLILLFSNHEAIVFVFTNGLVGLSLGYYDSILKHKLTTSLLTGIQLFFSLCVVNFFIGIPIFVVSFKASVFLILGIFVFSIIYVFIYYNFIYYLIHKIKLLKDYLK